jgi:hypothetical protein
MHCSRVDAFRHRADPIIADPAGAGHAYRLLTLTGRDQHALGLDPGVELRFCRTNGLVCPEIAPELTGREGVMRHEGHPPWIVADIEMGARGGKSGRRKLRNHLRFAITLQADARAQLPVVRQCG